MKIIDLNDGTATDTAQLTPVLSAFHSLMAAVYAEPVTDVQRKDLQRFFFAGARVILDLADISFSGDQPDAELILSRIELLTAAHRELDRVGRIIASNPRAWP